MDSPAYSNALAGKFRPVVRILEDGAKNGGDIRWNHGLVHRSLAVTNDSLSDGMGILNFSKEKIHENELETLGTRSAIIYLASRVHPEFTCFNSDSQLSTDSNNGTFNPKLGPSHSRNKSR
jgi:hypothetical protein